MLFLSQFSDLPAGDMTPKTQNPRLPWQSRVWINGCLVHHSIQPRCPGRQVCCHVDLTPRAIMATGMLLNATFIRFVHIQTQPRPNVKNHFPPPAKSCERD
jgi:hypothetical protein